MYPPGTDPRDPYFDPQDLRPALLYCEGCDLEFDVDEARDTECPICRGEMVEA